MTTKSAIGSIRQYDVIPSKHFEKYVKIRKEQGERTTNPEILNKVLTQFKTVGKEDNAFFKRVFAEMNQNEALAQFALDYNGVVSKFFFPWLTTVWDAKQAIALESAFGAGCDCDGEWHEEIPKYDPFWYFVCNDPTFVYTRLRTGVMAKLATESQKQARQTGKKSKVLDFGAGMMSWARYTDFEFDPNVQQICAYDLNKSIVPDELFRKSLKDLNLSYQIADMQKVFTDPKNRDADLVFMAGIMTYLTEEQIIGILKTVYRLLKPDGKFFFDMQLDCSYLQRSVAVFGWQELHLPTAKEASAKINALLLRLSEEGVTFDPECVREKANPESSALMVTLTKN